MTHYIPPLNEIRFALRVHAQLDDLGLEPDLVDAVLEEAAKLAAEVIAPTNQAGDREGAILNPDKSVQTASGFKAAYVQMQQAGWCGAPFNPDHGGQGLPWPLCFALQEMWASGNMAFSLCPLLTQGAVEVIATHGTEAQKALYLEKLTTGAWTGSMQLTEPQAGSDVGALRLKAVRAGDHYRLFGQKIYITYGEHDFTENIIHMVLGRVEGAPAGVKGISLFIVPKILADGTRNDAYALSLEHKLGIHGSPTAVMSYGEAGQGAVAYLLGEENRGMEYMFIMMNSARLGVGLQGLAVAERALQQARAYARERVQSRPLGRSKAEAVAIIQHPDIKRMLLTMRAYTEAMRALAYASGGALARGKAGDAVAAARADLLTPIVKAWGTDLGVECTSLNIQIHGGMGYIEETGAAQLWRDSRIACIYEGTNGIQANDLLFRKIARDGGAAALSFIAQGHAVVAALQQHHGDDAEVMAVKLAQGLAALERAIVWAVKAGTDDPSAAAAGATALLRLFGQVAGGVMLGQAACVALEHLQHPTEKVHFYTAKIIIARFYLEQLLPPCLGLADGVESASRTILAMPDESL